MIAALKFSNAGTFRETSSTAQHARHSSAPQLSPSARSPRVFRPVLSLGRQGFFPPLKLMD
jgi:hypothetical protein